MKRHLKKVVLAMIAFVLCGVINVSLAATDVETEQTAELEAASTVKHVSARKLYHAGDYLYIETSKGVLAYNMKKQTAKYVVESDGVSGVLVHKGYLYYR
jgi:ligand-binding sensor domain-containing protein